MSEERLDSEKVVQTLFNRANTSAPSVVLIDMYNALLYV